MVSNTCCFIIIWLNVASVTKVAWGQNWNNRAHAVTACIGLWCHGRALWHHRLITLLLNALTVWDLKFQVCLRYTFTPATLFGCFIQSIDLFKFYKHLWSVVFFVMNVHVVITLQWHLKTQVLIFFSFTRTASETIAKAGKPHWRGRLGTLDLLIKIAYFFNTEKHSYNMKRGLSELVNYKEWLTVTNTLVSYGIDLIKKSYGSGP